MRILALTNLYPNPFQPNRAQHNRHRLRLLAQRHEMRVIAPILWTDELAARRKGIARLPPNRQVTCDGIVVDHPRYWYTPKVLRGLYGRFFLESVRQTFRRVAAELQPDLVFAPWAYPDGWAAVQLAKGAGLPVVTQVHGSDIRHLSKFASRTCGTKAAVQQADGVIAVSQDLGQRVIELGADRANVRVIIDGVDQTAFHPGDKSLAKQRLGLEPERKHLLFVGNLAEVKGVDVLLRACAALGDTAKAWKLHLIGDGPLRSRLATLARSLGLAEQVTFHGSIAHHELPAWFRAADLFVLPSRSEGVPNVLLEASACGTPYVASDVGGILEIAHLGASRLVPPEQPQRLAEAIRECLLQPPSQPAQGPSDRQAAADQMSLFFQEVQERTSASRELVA